MSQINHIKHFRAGKALFLALFLALFCCVLFSSTALAALDNFVHGKAGVAIGEGKLVLSLPMGVDNEDALGEMLRDGSTMELSVKAVIERKRTLWFNDGLYEETFSFLLRHDPLSRDYRMTLPGNSLIAQDKSLRSLLTSTWKIMKLPLVDESLLRPNNDYLVKILLSLKHTALPPWLDRTLVFWNKNVVNPISLELEYRTEDAVISR